MTKEEAIKDIEENILPFVGGKSLRMAIDALRQPERKTGTWNRYCRMHSGDTFACNKCGSCFVILQGEDKMNFCPNCGADMRGEQDETN